MQKENELKEESLRLSSEMEGTANELQALKLREDERERKEKVELKLALESGDYEDEQKTLIRRAEEQKEILQEKLDHMERELAASKKREAEMQVEVVQVRSELQKLGKDHETVIEQAEEQEKIMHEQLDDMTRETAEWRKRERNASGAHAGAFRHVGEYRPWCLWRERTKTIDIRGPLSFRNECFAGRSSQNAA